MPEVPTRVLSFGDALEAVYAASTSSRCPSTEHVSLLAAHGRILAEAVRADRDQPAFDRVTRDGFAVRAADLTDNAWLPVVGEVRAGGVWEAALPHASALAIMTGAPLPTGADAVVMIEHVEQADITALHLWPTEDRPHIRLCPGRKLHAGENYVPRGSEAHAGQSVVASGTRIGAAEIALAASCGQAQLAVYRRPRVSILSTGDELVPLDGAPADHQIRNSNSYALAALVEEAGGEPILLPIAPDEREALAQALQQAREADLLLITGGVSMGAYDLVEEALLAMGAEFHFTGVRMQPGKPAVFGRLPKARSASGETLPPVPFFGLPGNPISAQVTFACFAAPLLRTLCGAPVETAGPGFVHASLGEAVKAKPGLTRVLPALLRSTATASTVTLVPWQGSGDMAAHVRANCYAVLPDGTRDLAAGDAISVLLR
jgi:molybdopterin molybdotransferase